MQCRRVMVAMSYPRYTFTIKVQEGFVDETAALIEKSPTGIDSSVVLNDAELTAVGVFGICVT